MDALTDQTSTTKVQRETGVATRVVLTSFDPGRATAISARFVATGARLQAQTPGRIVADVATTAARLLPDFAFYTYGQALHLVATVKGVDVGRCSAMINTRALDDDGRQNGYIGNWECIDDDAVAFAMLDKAVEWLREHDCHQIFGPIDFSTWYGYRFSIGPWEAPPVLFEPYTPPHYDEQWRRFGFAYDETYFTDRVDDPGAYVTRTEERLKTALEMGVRFRCLNRAKFDEALRSVYDLSVDQFSNPHFTKVDFDEFKAMYAGSSGSIDPRLFIFAIAPDGSIGGFVFGIPNFARASAALQGQPTLPRKLRALANKRHANSVLIKTFAVDKRMRGYGIGSLLANRVIQAAADLGYDRVHNMTMHESNLSKKMSEGGGGVPIRRYATYRLASAASE